MLSQRLNLQWRASLLLSALRVVGCALAWRCHQWKKTTSRKEFCIDPSQKSPKAEKHVTAEKFLHSIQHRPKAKRKDPTTPYKQRAGLPEGGRGGPEKAAVSQIEHESHVKSKAESAMTGVTFAQRLASSRMRFGMTLPPMKENHQS